MALLNVLIKMTDIEHCFLFLLLGSLNLLQCELERRVSPRQRCAAPLKPTLAFISVLMLNHPARAFTNLCAQRRWFCLDFWRQRGETHTETQLNVLNQSALCRLNNIYDASTNSSLRLSFFIGRPRFQERCPRCCMLQRLAHLHSLSPTVVYFFFKKENIIMYSPCCKNEFMYVCKIQTLHSCVISLHVARDTADVGAYFHFRHSYSFNIKVQFPHHLHGTAD